MQQLNVSMKRKRMVGAMGLFLIFAVILLTFLSKTIHNTLLPNITAVQYVKGSLQEKFEADGAIEYLQKQGIFAGGNWMVKEVKVNTGQHVNKGDLLAVIDSNDIQRDLQAEELELMKLENDIQSYKDNYQPITLSDYERELELVQQEMDMAKSDLDMIKELFEVGSESMKNVEAAEYTYRSKLYVYQARKQSLEEKRKDRVIEQAEYNRILKEKMAELEIKKTEIAREKDSISEDGTVVANMDGIITTVGIEPGMSTIHNQTIFQIAAEPYSHRIVWYLDAENYYKFSINDDVIIEAMAEVSVNNNKVIKAMSLKGKITGRIFHAESGRYKFQADISNKEDIENVFFNEGQSARVRSSASSPLYEYVLPKSCITQVQGQDCIFVVNKKQGALGEEYYVEKREVKILGQDDFNAAVDCYFKKNDIVVSSTTKPLTDMMQVYVNMAVQDNAR